MKAYWFAFNPSDWLSAKSVRMMSLAERGAYIGLLATAWGEDRPGTLPAAEDTIRRLAEMSPADWVVSGPCLLAMFPLSECGTYRYNPRLLEEAGKREELSEKKAEAGRRSAAKRAAISTQQQQTANTIPTGVEISATGVAENANQLQSQLQLQKEEEVRASPPVEPSSPKSQPTPKSKGRAGAAADSDEDLIPVELSPLTDPIRFKAIVLSEGYPTVDIEHYRLRILNDSAGMALPINRWRKRIASWLENDKRAGKLVLPTPMAADGSPIMQPYQNLHALTPAPTPLRATASPTAAVKSWS